MEPSDDLNAAPATPYIRLNVLGSHQQTALLYSGLLFMLSSVICFCSLIWTLIRDRDVLPFGPEKGGNELVFYVGAYLPAIILFLSAIVCAMVGYSLLNAAGASTKEVIPRQDYNLLSTLVSEEKEKAIDLYVRLNSLSGMTGFFTKIGISGLPLATIALSLIFTLLALIDGSNTKLYDLANLTLGAFLGSYVQRQVSSPRTSRNNNDNA